MEIASIINSIYIFISYFLLVIVLSAFILKPRLTNEGVLKRFMIYMVVGNIYISTIVFILAYLNIFNRPALIITIALLSALIRFSLNKDGCTGTAIRGKSAVENLILGRYGFRLLVSNLYQRFKKYVRDLSRELFDGRKIEWLIFLSLLFYNIYQYGINTLELSTYMALDEEVHLYWIQSMIKGSIYPSGVYPHVFHNIIAALMQIFNINAMVMIRFFSITSSILIVTSIYIGLRKVFNSKYPALFGFLIYTLADFYIEESTARLQFTIPQEYGMIMLIPIVVFLIDYIRDKKRKDLIFFGLALALTVAIHFYTGIIGIILTMAVVMVYIYKIIKDKIFLKLIVACFLSALVAIAPLATGLALGHEMEQSMSWAQDVIKGEIYSSARIKEKNIETSEKPKPDEEVEESLSIKEDIKIDLVKYAFTDIRLFYFFLITIILTIIYSLALVIRKKNTEKNMYRLVFSLNSLILLFLIMFKALGLPTIMQPKRVTIYFVYFSAIWLGMPLELLIKILNKEAKKLVPLISITAMAIALTVIIKADKVRPISSIYYFQTSGTMNANLSIMKNYKDFTWTVISPVNNITPVLNHGFHYELDEFIKTQENWDKNQEIKIPTEYIFIYIEKRPIVYYGNHFYRNDVEIVGRKFIQRDDALKDFSGKEENNYIYRKERDILMAKAYYWAKEYKRFFPNEMNVYYEDNELVVYRIRQNPYALNNLSIDYKINRK